MKENMQFSSFNVQAISLTKRISLQLILAIALESYSEFFTRQDNFRPCFGESASVSLFFYY